jgi:hypothetical protein
MRHQRKVHLATTPVDSPWRVVYRFFIGQDLNGGYKTNHTWLKAGTQITSHNGRATRWAHQPMRRRAGIRVLGLFGFISLVLGAVVAPAATVITLRVLTWMTLGAVGWVVHERARKYIQMKTELRPLAEAVANYLKDSRYVHNPREWIQLPVDTRDGTTTVYLPIDYSPSELQERTFSRLVGRRVGLLHPSFAFELEGERPRLEVRPAPAPRDLVDFADPSIRAMVERAREGQLFLGLGPRDVPYYLDLNVQAPHIGMSMSTNAGKSTTGRGLLMQHLHEGGIALILDPKMDSQLWARGLPNVRYADTPQEIHEALLWLSDELDRRSNVTKAHADIRGDVDPALVGPRLMVVAEELNTLETDVAIYWRSIRDPKAGDPIKPTSLAALGRALNMGRARRINAFMIAQELLVQSLGGPAAKTNLSTRILGRANTPTWNKLAPECKRNGKYPRKSMHRGRVYVVTGDEALPVQTMKADEQDAIDYATSGVVSTFPTKVSDWRPAGEGGSEGGSRLRTRDHRETGGSSTDLPHVFMPIEDDDELDEDDALEVAEGPEIDEELVTLAKAAVVLDLPLKTLQNARDRGSPGFPKADPDSVSPGKASRYFLPDLEKWALNHSGKGGAA